MWGEENSAACWAFPSSKRQRPAGVLRRGERGKKWKGAGAANNRILLFGSMRELALYRAEVLRQKGFHVITPSDRAEAIEAVENGGLGAAILSYTLSNDVVEEMAELLKQKCPACPLIAISQTGRVDRRIEPDEIVIADQGPAALLQAVGRAMRNRLQ